MSKKEKPKYVAVGGQALMEGIMMKGPKGTAMACRLPDGTIDTEMKNMTSIRKKYKFLNIPIIRGVIAFIESMIQGYKLLMESAEKTSMDLGDEPAESKFDKWIEDHFGPKMMAVIGTIASILGIGLAFVLFVWMPSFVFDLINKYAVKSYDLINFRALFEGLIRIVIFVVYMWLTSKMKEIHRVYMYHGAEHKTIFCFEHGNELTPENVMKEGRLHPRCGTSFIFVTIILSILISSAVAVICNVYAAKHGIDSITSVRWKWMVLKLCILPAIMGIGFEFIQLAGKYPNKFTKALSAPGLAMQKITTAEPDEAICEVAIAAMKACLTGEVPAKPSEEEAADEETVKTDISSVVDSDEQINDEA